MVTLIGAALAAAVLALVLKKDSPALALMVAVAGVLVLMTGLIEPTGQLIRGIAAAVRIAGAVCQDAGQAALAAQLELAGTAAAIVVCLPLLTEVLELVNRMIA